MIGMLINEKERKEIEYILKKELDEIIFELNDERIDHMAKRSMNERYRVLFTILKRVAPPNECFKYIMQGKRA